MGCGLSTLSQPVPLCCCCATPYSTQYEVLTVSTVSGYTGYTAPNILSFRAPAKHHTTLPQLPRRWQIPSGQRNRPPALLLDFLPLHSQSSSFNASKRSPVQILGAAIIPHTAAKPCLLRRRLTLGKTRNTPCFVSYSGVSPICGQEHERVVLRTK